MLARRASFTRIPSSCLYAGVFGTAMLLAALFAARPLQAQVPQQVIAAPNVQGPSSVAAADLDGDGDQDMISASFDDNKIAWYENQIDGPDADRDGFGSQRVVSTRANDATSVATADLNGDGAPDLLVASYENNTIAWYENQIGESEADGDGFGDRQVISTRVNDAFSVAAADLDGDGDPDVLSASLEDDTIAWYENKMDDADADADGFGDQQIISTQANGAASVAAADLDGDGDADVLSASSFDDKIAWYENRTGETGADDDGFGSQHVISTQANGAASVAVADLDGDGNPDVLSASSIDDEVAWYENKMGTADADADGFGSERIIAFSASRAQSVTTADLDGDDDPDVLSASSVDDRIAWYENKIGDVAADADGFGRQKTITDRADRAWTVAAADLNGDGSSDVLSTSLRDNKVAWYENQIGEPDADSDGFGLQRTVTTGAVGPQSVAVADLNGDGDADALSASFGDDMVAWYENEVGEPQADSDGFGPQHPITTRLDRVWSVTTADLDGDDDPDVLSAAFGNGTIAWYENRIGESGADGDGFGSRQTIASDAGSAQSVAAADVDGDGNPDVLSAFGNTIAWYENQMDEPGTDGDGFGSRQTITTNARGAASVAAAHVDGDDDVDVLSASSFDDRIAWYENQVGEAGADGDGFGPQQTITTSARGAQSVGAADLDGDGDTDVFSASSSDSRIAWYENKIDEGAANDGFGEQRVVTTKANSAASVTAADLDKDGKRDLVSASLLDDKIAWYKNQMDQGGADHDGFSSQRLVNTQARGATSVAVADLNGDEYKEILAASLSGDKVAWYRNEEGVFPVELVDFKARVVDKAVRLSWMTASETNNAGFRIQRRAPASRDNVTPSGQNDRMSNWETIGRVEGTGTTSESQSYRYTDADLPYEVARLSYRLKQIDTDGSASYSDPVTVRRSVETIQLLGPSPNPASQQVTVRYALPDYRSRTSTTIRLYDVLGRAVRTVVNEKTAGRHEKRMDVSGLSSGVYFLRLRSGKKVRTQKLTILE